MPFPFSLVATMYNAGKDLVLYYKGQRRDFKDLEGQLSGLILDVTSIESAKEGIDSDSKKKTKLYHVMEAEIAVIGKKCKKLIAKYEMITNTQLGDSNDSSPTATSKMIEKLGDLKSEMNVCNFLKLAKLSRDTARLSMRASRALDKLKLENMTQKNSKTSQVKLDDQYKFVLPVFDTYVDKVLEYLFTEKGQKVGIVGCQGAGKTTVLKKLYNRLIDERESLPLGDRGKKCRLDYIIRTNYPPEKEKEDKETVKEKIVAELQNEIMEQLDIRHEVTTSKIENANKISTFLCHKKYVLLINKVSSIIDLEELGLRKDHECGKVVICSREKDVILKMTEHEVEIKRLEVDEARILFENICGESYDKRLRGIGEMIIKCCAGIPWMIEQIAIYLKDKKDESSWNGAKYILQSDSRSLPLLNIRGFDKVYEMKYEGLDTESQKCLLYGTLFPDQHEIPTDFLIDCWIAEGFIVKDGKQKVRLCRDHGQPILDHLTDQYLLEKSGKKNVIVLPDFRRVASTLKYPDDEQCVIWVPSMDRDPDNTTWTTVTRMSLIGCEVELPQSPQCTNIHTLLLESLKQESSRIPDDFFTHMKRLRVLDLNETEIGALPISIRELVNLKSLYLKDCLHLHALPREVASLVQLEFLDIRGTSIPTLPQEIKYMVNLRCLRASLSPFDPNKKGKQAVGTDEIELIIPTGIISSLKNLEELSIDAVFNFEGGIDVAKRLAEELAKLRHLNTLCFKFPNVNSLNIFVTNSEALNNEKTGWGKHTLRSFKIVIGCQETRRGSNEPDFSGIQAERWLRYSTNSEEFSPACQNLLKQASAFEIIGHDDLMTCGQFDLSSVKVCVVEGCKRLENIMDGNIASKKQGIVQGSLLQNMEKLYLYNLESLQCIWAGPVPTTSFTKLSAITIAGCPRLTKILDHALALSLQGLEYLKVDNCCQITKIIEGNGETSHEIEEIHEESDLLKTLTKIELSNLPELQSICENNTSISWNSLRSITVMRCSRLSNLCLTVTNARNLASIQCEKSWWNTLSLPNEVMQRLLPVCCYKVEESIEVGEASTSGSSEITEDITSSENTSINNGSQSLEEETPLTDNLQASKMDVRTDSFSCLEEDDCIPINGSHKISDHDLRD